MGKRKRHAESREGLDGATHKRTKVEVPASTPGADFIDPAGSDQPSKKSKNDQKAPLQVSRKHDNAGRSRKHEEKEKAQSVLKVEVPVQKGKVRSSGHRHAGSKEHNASTQESRKHREKPRALRRAANKQQSGQKAEMLLQNDNSNKREGHEHAEGSEHTSSLPESRRRNNAEGVHKRAEDEEQSGPKVEEIVENKNDKSEVHEHAGGDKHSAPLRESHKRRKAKTARKRAGEKKQSGPKVETPVQIEDDKSEVHEDDERKKKTASLQSSHKRNNEERALNHQAKEAGLKVDVAVQDRKEKRNVHEHAENVQEGSPTNPKIDEVPATQQIPITAKKSKQDKAQKQDKMAIAVSESGKEHAGKDESEVVGRLGDHDVRKPLSQKTKSKSSKKKQLNSLELEGMGPVEGEVIESSGGPDAQRHSSKKKSKVGKKNKLRSTDVREADCSVADESALEKAVAASYPEWNIARSTGGQMLDTDPMFSKDEEYLLITYPTYVSVYATATSLPVGTLRIKKGERIAATCLSPLDPKRVYIISKSGLIELWDWSDSKKIDSWKLSRDSMFFRLDKGGESYEQVLAYIVHEKPVFQLCAYDLTNTGRISQDLTRPLFTHDAAITSLDVLDDGKQIVMTSGAQVILGTCQDPHPTDLQSLTYDWHIVTCPDWIASIDVRVRPANRDKKGQQKKQGPYQSIDLALGCLRGSIHLYDDLQHKLYQQQTSSHKGQANDVTSRQLHWHRNAVQAVKWSKDGRYVISGGQETVLVNWQLDTGRKDMLPHLGAPIENLVISPQGSSYVVRLADNSAMILSTAEMRPTFSVAGIQMPSMNASSNLLPTLPNLDRPNVDRAHARTGLVSKSPSPASVWPSRPGQLLMAVPPYCASRSSTIMSGNASYLQSIDLHSSQQLSRQALVRTKVTDLNMGPEGNLIEEPDVKHIATSHDGQWLATADEWTPPARDIEPLTFDSEKTREEQIFRLEIHLKFWSWNQGKEIWELVARIDNPHSSSSGSAYESGRVIALISDLSDIGFVTFGEDGCLKSWRPIIRRRHGSQVKGKDGVALTNWQCSFSTFIMNLNEAGTTSTQPAAKLACSPDGSVIALSLQTDTAAPIYLLDGFDGSIRSVQTGRYSAPLLGLGIIDRHLIIVAYDLVVWDLVNDEEHYRVNLELLDLPHSTLTTHSHLAVNLHDQTFALVTPAQGHRAKGVAGLKSDIAIFDPFQEKPLFIETLPHATISLQPEVGGRGYYAIDSFAEIRAITPQASLPSPPEEATVLLSQTSHPKGLDELFGRPSEDRQKLIADQSDSMDVGDTNGNEGKRPEVKLEQLQALFSQAPSHELPPVNELFRQVIGLYGRKDSAAVA